MELLQSVPRILSQKRIEVGRAGKECIATPPGSTLALHYQILRVHIHVALWAPSALCLLTTVVLVKALSPEPGQ